MIAGGGLGGGGEGGLRWGWVVGDLVLTEAMKVSVGNMVVKAVRVAAILTGLREATRILLGVGASDIFGSLGG